jgi:hypothetical protein
MPSTCSVDKRTIYHVFLNDTRPLLLMSSISTIDIHINPGVELKLGDSNQGYISPLKTNFGLLLMSKVWF